MPEHALSVGRAAHHRRDQAGECERDREQAQCHHRHHDQLPSGGAWWGRRISRRRDHTMPNPRRGGCDGHHEMVDCLRAAKPGAGGAFRERMGINGFGSPAWIRTAVAAFKVRQPAVRRRSNLVRPRGFEPLPSRLKGERPGPLDEGRIGGAGSGSRTRVFWVEASGSAVELRPHQNQSSEARGLMPGC